MIANTDLGGPTGSMPRLKDVHRLTAAEIVEIVATGQATPSEIVDGLVRRIEALDPTLHAWTAVDPSNAKEQATALVQPHGGCLHAVPVGVKDVFNTQYYATEKGSSAWSGYRAGNDARCVSYLRWHGAIVLGKTDTAELAVHAGVRARNPHQLSRHPGSSSSGSAVAVSSGMVPVALGTQTGGSIVRPASWCGVYGMKPSFGLVPRTGVLKTSDTLDTVGFFSRSSADLPLLLDALRVRGDNFPVHERRLAALGSPPSRPWRIAFAPAAPSRTESQASSALKVFRNHLDAEDGFQTFDFNLPAATQEFYDVHRRIYHSDLGYYLRSEMARHPGELSDVLLAILEDAKSVSGRDYAAALQQQAEIASVLDAELASLDIDAVFTLASDGEAPLVAEPARHDDWNPLWTLAWLPVVSVPAFKTASRLPYGLAVVGRRYSDYRLLKLLQALHAAGVLPEAVEPVEPPFLP